MRDGGRKSATTEANKRKLNKKEKADYDADCIEAVKMAALI